MMPRPPGERVCVGKIGAPHGVRGEVKLWSFTADPGAVKDYGALVCDDGRSVVIETMRPAKDGYVARLRGISDRNAAEALRNAQLFVPRERLPQPDSDEFYHADLIGLDAVDETGVLIGSVIAVHNFGAGDLLELKAADAGATILLPFTETVIPRIDVAARRLVVRPPPLAAEEAGD